MEAARYRAAGQMTSLDASETSGRDATQDTEAVLWAVGNAEHCNWAIARCKKHMAIA
jgi:hypothetical protein